MAATIVSTAGPQWSLGDYIKKARTEAGLMQTDIARKLGVSKQLVSRWENNLSIPSVVDWRHLAVVTGAHYLWDLDALPTPDEDFDPSRWLGVTAA